MRFFGHPQANTLSDINITREDIIDAIKTMLQKMLQNDLHKLYKWADTKFNNMKFNANKFELLRYGKEQEIKSATTYKSYDDSNIGDKN